MISIKNVQEIEKMRRAGRVAAMAREAAKRFIERSEPGHFTTADIDRAVADCIRAQGALPSFLGYGGFSGNACVSVNEEVIHGIPGKRILRDGDIVKVDVGATIDGFIGDCAATFFVGTPSAAARRLAEATRESFFRMLPYARVGYRVSDISNAVQTWAESQGYSVVRSYIGHGVGRKLHEDPDVPNFGAPGHGPRLLPGMTLAVEPMVNEGTWEISVLPDGWTVVTGDRKLSAHYENTILITRGDPEILTWHEQEI